MARALPAQVLTAEDREAQNEMQGLLCGCLQVITCKLGPAIKPHADQMMQARAARRKGPSWEAGWSAALRPPQKAHEASGGSPQPRGAPEPR